MSCNNLRTDIFLRGSFSSTASMYVFKDISHIVFLGWMFFTKEQLGERPTRLQIAVQYLQKAIETDNTSGASWYLLGRYTQFYTVQTVQYHTILLCVHTGWYNVLHKITILNIQLLAGGGSS